MNIKFYSTKGEHGYMSNFYRAKQRVGWRVYPTNEHYYQSQKARDPKIQAWIASAPNPYLAMMAGRSLRLKEFRNDWGEIKFDIMEQGIYAKFSQNRKLRKKLLETGPQDLHEDSPTDMIWGIRGKKTCLGRY